MCTGTAQVGASLAAPLDSLFKRKIKKCYINTHSNASTMNLPITCWPSTMLKLVYTSLPQIEPYPDVNLRGVMVHCAYPPLAMLPCLPFLSFLSLLSMCGLDLCSFSGLVCNLPLRGGRGLSPDCALPKEHFSHNLNGHWLEDSGAIWCLTQPRVAAHHKVANRLREILHLVNCFWKFWLAAAASRQFYDLQR